MIWMMIREASSRVRVELGSRRPRGATARVLTTDESIAALSAYAVGSPAPLSGAAPRLRDRFRGTHWPWRHHTPPGRARHRRHAADAAARPLAASVEIAAASRHVGGRLRHPPHRPVVAGVPPRRSARPRPRGCWMFGINRRRAIWWTTLSRTDRFARRREIAWRVVTNGSVWSHRLEATPGGTRVVETRETPTGVGRVPRWPARTFLGGQRSHDDELETGMARGLQQIKAIVESEITHRRRARCCPGH